jgi:hypothetical protein
MACSSDEEKFQQKLSFQFAEKCTIYEKFKFNMLINFSLRDFCLMRGRRSEKERKISLLLFNVAL